jgi:hypothetical protein
MNFYIKEINKSIAKQMIIKNHYSHKFSKCTIALGIFEKTEEVDEFFDIRNDKLIGTIVYGDPVGSNVSDSISKNTKQGEILELTRLWIQDDTPKNTESWSISQSFNWIKQNLPKIKVIISYADPAAGHTGKIYQATNFLYCPTGQTAGDYCVSFDGLNFVHVRTLENSYGGLGLKNILEKLPRPFWVKKNSTKVRYIYILANKKEKREILRMLKYQPQPYPKTAVVTGGEITKYE